MSIRQNGTERNHSMAMIEISNLSKEYRTSGQKLLAVNNISLALDKGDIFGFIGPNGAGKTTTIKMIATLLVPSSGSVFVDGLDVVKEPDKVRSILGYMPDSFGVYDDIKVWEYLDFFAAAYKISKDKRPAIIDDVLSLTDLSVKKNAYVESLSRGMKQRLCLAKTLVHDPKVMLLDEPASGLDPRARIEIRELLRELQRMGKTIMISSHILPEMEEFCNKIGIIEKGEMIVSGDVRTISRQVRGNQVIEITVLEELERAVSLLESMNEYVNDVKIMSRSHNENQNTHFSSSTGHSLQFGYIGEPNHEYVVLNSLVDSGLKIRAFHSPKADLEDVFMRVTKGLVN